MIRLTKGQVLQMHAELIAATGGSSGIRDEALLDAALAAPFMSFGGMDLYPSLEQKAARSSALSQTRSFSMSSRMSSSTCPSRMSG